MGRKKKHCPRARPRDGPEIPPDAFEGITSRKGKKREKNKGKQKSRPANQAADDGPAFHCRRSDRPRIYRFSARSRSSSDVSEISSAQKLKKDDSRSTEAVEKKIYDTATKPADDCGVSGEIFDDPGPQDGALAPVDAASELATELKAIDIGAVVPVVPPEYQGVDLTSLPLFNPHRICKGGNSMGDFISINHCLSWRRCI